MSNTLNTSQRPSNNISKIDELNTSLQQTLLTNGVLFTDRHKNCGSYKTLPDKIRPLDFKNKTKMSCGDKTSCPVCRYKFISKHRKKIYDLTNDFEGRILMNTLKLSHNKRNTLPYLYKGLKSSIRDMKNCHGWRTLKKDLDHQFHFDRIQIVVSPENGYHPHCHQIFSCLNWEISKEEIKERISNIWSMSVERNGLRKVTKEHGTDVQEGKGTILYPSPQEQDEESWKEFEKRLSDSKKPRKNVPKLKWDYTVGEMEREILYYQEIPKYKNEDFSKEEIVKHLSQIQKTSKGDYYCRVYQ